MTDPADPQPINSTQPVDAVLPGIPARARQLFGERVELAERYVARLAGDGVEHGHLGPREVPRLWERHLINCALVADLLPTGASLVDVGSGAGLPGLPVAIRRPDLQICLLEPMLRRSEFLAGCVADLGLGGQVTVVRGRADDRTIARQLGGQQWVAARAVAPLDRLARWCLPLLAPGGILLAMKGSSAMDELAEHRAEIERLGGDDISVLALGDPDEEGGTRVVSIRRSSRGLRHQGVHR